MSLAERVIELTVTMQLKPAQAIAMAAMFDHWNYLSSVGSDRYVAFYVAGDGDFHPKCKVSYNIDPMTFNQNPMQTLENLKKMALAIPSEAKQMPSDSRFFDFDSIAWSMHPPYEPKVVDLPDPKPYTQITEPPTDMLPYPDTTQESNPSLETTHVTNEDVAKPYT